MTAETFFAAHNASNAILEALTDDEIVAADEVLRALTARERAALSVLIDTRATTPDAIAAKCEALAALLRRETFEDEQHALAHSIAADLTVERTALERLCHAA